MKASVRARRLAYRIGYQLLRTWWRFVHPELNGVKCVITDADKVLLVVHTYGPRQWDLPGGKIAAGEPAPAAASREMEEELGLRDVQWQALGELRVYSEGRHDTLHAFQGAVGEQTLRVNLAELAVVAWFDRHELPTPLAPHADELIARLPPVG